MTHASEYDQHLEQTRIPQALLAWVSDNAQKIDSGEMEAREALPHVAAEGILNLGAPANSDGGLVSQASALQRLAQYSLSVPFAMWGHRMVLEFLELAGGSYAESILPTLRAGSIPGAPAMAPGYKSLANAEDLALHITHDKDNKLYLSGEIAWASNLYTDAIAVAPAYGPQATDRQGPLGGVIVAFPLDAPGVQIGPELDILAMRGTASTYASLDHVEISHDQILSDNFTAFLKNTRPTLSILQASLCLGLATASYRQAIENAYGFNSEFRPEIQDCGNKLASTKSQLVRIASQIGISQPPSPHEVLAKRLQAGQLATQFATLELKTAGGKAFVTTSDTNRRYREATFIPLQAPSEAQLRWELAQA